MHDQVKIYFLRVNSVVSRVFLDIALNYHLNLNYQDWLNPIRDGLFRGCSRMGGGGGKKAYLSHISYNDETWHSYTLPKGDPKNI